MTIYFGADHRGFELKNQLVAWLKSQNHTVTDCGNTVADPLDDFPDFSQPVAKKIQQEKESLGILICGSGVGVSIAANRYKGVYCGTGFNEAHVKHIRENDHINILALPSDLVDFEQAKKMVTVFLTAQPIHQEKYTRRLKKIDSL